MDIIKDSRGIEYQVINGTCYHIDTPKVVINILESNRQFHNDQRLRLYYGDSKTGLAWGDTCSGYIGRSTGSIKIPLIIHNLRSLGGPGILDHCIVKVEYANGSWEIWKHKLYHEDVEHPIYKR